MALDSGFRSIQNMLHTIFRLVKKKLHIVSFFDNESMWSTVMNIAVSTIDEENCRSREAIYMKMINSVCHISEKNNPADDMTKSEENNMLAECI